MIRKGSRALTIAAGLALMAAAMPGLRLRGGPRVLSRAQGVRLERVDEALVPHADRLDADDGDLLLSDGQVQLVVGASEEPGDDFEYGAILDVTGPDWADDALASIRTVVSVNDHPVRVVTDRVAPLIGKGAPAIRISQHAGSVLLTTDVVLQALTSKTEIVTRAVNRGKTPLTVRLGDDVVWPGVPTFAPGLGEVEGDENRTLSWIARRGPLAYGLVFPTTPSAVEFHVDRSDTDQTCFAPEVELAPAASTTYRRVLVATRRGVSEVASVAASLTGKAVGRVVGALSPVPAWALLTAIASDGSTAMKEAAHDDGTFDLALPPDRYTIVLQTPGGWDQTIVDVKSGDASGPAVAGLLSPQSERLDFRVTDGEGKPIPARLIVIGIDGTLDPRFASVPRVSAAGNEIHTVSGDGRVDIPQGRYRVVVSRGIEWSVVQKVIEVKPEQGVALRVQLTHDLPTPGWISADLHLHARPSGDSELPLDDRIASLVSAGVEFAVATDHNHVTDYGPTIDAVGAHPVLASTRGVEVTTRTWGHFNAYPLPVGAAPPPFAKVDPPEIFAAIRQAAPDAVIQVNHPWNPGYGYFRRAVLDERRGTHWRKQFSFDFDLIEVVNGYELGKIDVLGKNLPRYFDLLNLGGRRYTAVGSSDSHKLTNEWAGYPRTYVHVADDRVGHVTATELAASLRSGHTVVSLGPFVDASIGDAGPGDTVQAVPGTVPLAISVRAAGWIDVTRVDIVLGGDTVDSFDIEPSTVSGVRWERTVDVPVAHDSWIAVIARGERPIDEVLPGLHVAPFAFTNPIWVDVGAPAPTPPSYEKHGGRGARPAGPPSVDPVVPSPDDTRDEREEVPIPSARPTGTEPPVEPDAGASPTTC